MLCLSGLIPEFILIATARHVCVCSKRRESYESEGFFTLGNKILHGHKCNFATIIFNPE